ncbi:8551_t:CDS:1, partial [Paraglomus occultum]
EVKQLRSKIDTLKDKIRTKSKEKKDFLPKMEALENALASKDDELKQMKDDLALKFQRYTP